MEGMSTSGTDTTPEDTGDSSADTPQRRWATGADAPSADTAETAGTAGAADSADTDRPAKTIAPATAAHTFTDTLAQVGFDPEHPEEFEKDKPTDRAVLIGIGGRWLTDWALRLAIVIVTGWLLSKIIGYLWVGILPILLALIVSTVLWPPVKYMRKAHVPAALAALLSILLAFGIVGGIIAAITPSIVSQAPRLIDSTTTGILQVQDWIQGPPLNIRDEQIDSAVNEVTSVLQQRGNDIANGVLTGVTTIGSLMVTLVLVLVLTFFFIKDGVRFLPWLRRVTGRNAGRHLTEVLTRSWVTLSGFIRTQAIVSFMDAFFIGLGLVILGVPLAWALAVITFLAGFIPIVGAFTAGAVAVLVALVSNGLTTALIVLALIIAVQQLEGNILQPILQSRSMDLHPVVVLLSVAAGGALFGIVGAFLAVPIAAVLAVIMRYLGEQIDLRTGDRSAADVSAATEEGKLTAWLAEIGASKFRNVPGLSGIAAAVTGDHLRTGGEDTSHHHHHKADGDAAVAESAEPTSTAGEPASDADTSSSSSSGGTLIRAAFRRARSVLKMNR